MTFVENYQSQGVMIIRNRQHDLLLSFSHFLIDMMIDPDHLFFTNSITVHSLNDLKPKSMVQRSTDLSNRGDRS